ncbi:peroxisomal (S)-2-hydroxy-acid oxidase GLO3-like [Amphibalanus amphitrite]|uniref:peroxisomal (S)-2-hydroxy-acid oxidase GLO3-like n=1 Tax=Amphibalanus amphitrite TaxID=1232801 RepID=UPI001C90A816|nr:peroxisomal (S)-2-hydroxy-acid oxidase GLO3-like [Amphibalanus amphitrite]
MSALPAPPTQTMSSVVCCIDDLERTALARLDKNTNGYYNAGADAEQTLKENVTAYQRYRLRPRALVDISHVDLTQTVLGHRVSMPIGVAPSAMQKLAHPDGECANARAAEAMGTIYTLSTISTSSIEEVAAAAPKAVKWFQLYVLKNRDMTQRMVERAESAGFSALVLTVDAQMFGKRLADVRNGFKLPPHLSLANFDEEYKKNVKGSVEQSSGISHFVTSQFDPSLSWTDLAWLRSITKLPVLVKGIMTPEDALLAAEHGAGGVIVSNHGGRQLDGCLAAVDALRPVVAALAGRLPVFMDGGVRRGTDVIKALALGAQMVFVGRPMLWGLAYDGQRGAQLALTLLRDELRLAMGLCGVTKVEDVTDNILEKSDRSNL